MTTNIAESYLYQVSLRTYDVYTITVKAATEEEALAKAEAIYSVDPSQFAYAHFRDTGFQVEYPPL